MLSARQRDEFHRQGLLRLPGAIPLGDTTIMRDRLWAFMASQHAIQPHQPETWPTDMPRHFQALTHARVFDPMGNDVVCAALDDLLGADGWQRPRRGWGLPLVTFPQPGATWDVPAEAWHVDSHTATDDLPGVTVFAHLAATRPRGGGTLVLAGSHHLTRRIAAQGVKRSAALKARLGAAHPWLAALWTKGASQGDRVGRYLGGGAVVDGVHLRVEELTGDPGDVVLMHPRALHAPAPNCLDTPRMMLVNITGRNP